MKTITIVLVTLLTLVAACDFLDVDPITQIPAEDAFTDEKGVMAALNGAYDELQSAAIAQDVIVFGDMAADNLIHIGTKKEYRQISDQQIFTENAYISGMWNSAYRGINKVNNILAGIDNVTGMLPEDKDNVIAQCHFLRAFHYFNLVKYFGGVPLKTAPTRSQSPEELNVARESVTTIYNFIIEELTNAATILGGTGRTSSVYADEGAVMALLARVYLYTGNYSEAQLAAENVLNLGYELVEGTAFATLYDEGVSNDEIIFEIDFANDNETNEMADWFLPDGRFEVAAWNDPGKTGSIAEAFSDNDYRKTASVGSTDINGSLDYYCNKYLDYNEDSDNIIVLRLAEMYLIAAEAHNELGYLTYNGGADPPSAFLYLNTIRQRANLPELTSADLPDQASFRLAIEEERRLELAFEGHRYFDLVRTGRADDVIPSLGPLTGVNNYLFPLPRAEVDANEAIEENNPGY